jgi:2,4-dienoyl-CoA reductase-like NADH-dependent reductase (Old Yellow Enzyme family)
VIADFKAATIRAVKAGYQVMEIHAAHGIYCIHFSFNVRTDAYGGGLKQNSLTLKCSKQYNRNGQICRCLFVFRLRLGRWRLECRRICTALIAKRKGVDLIDVSSGALVPYQKIPVALSSAIC